MKIYVFTEYDFKSFCTCKNNVRRFARNRGCNVTKNYYYTFINLQGNQLICFINNNSYCRESSFWIIQFSFLPMQTRPKRYNQLSRSEVYTLLQFFNFHFDEKMLFSFFYMSICRVGPELSICEKPPGQLPS